jgi:hypothetical protein
MIGFEVIYIESGRAGRAVDILDPCTSSVYIFKRHDFYTYITYI